MLARWFDRSGIGQLLAPDPDADPVSENDECKSVIWQILAPDENFAPPKAPPAPPEAIFINSRQDSIRSSFISTNNNVPETPQTPPVTDTNDPADLNLRVLSACRDTSMYMRSPQPVRKNNDKFLRFCASTKPLAPKLMKKMRSMVEANSFKNCYLLRVRATKMGESAPDGYTSLMVAAYANHIDAAKLILELAETYSEATGDKKTYADLHLDRDMFGMTALHIAGECGHVEMIQFLLPLYQFPLPPQSNCPSASKAAKSPGQNSSHVPLVDLGGQTAFGRAVTSPVPKAKKNQRILEKNLFSRNDLSIFGNAKPMGERMGRLDSLGLEYGTSEMPGLRGYMEDALSVSTWMQQGSSSSVNGEMVLFAVCDGHGDNGNVSEFVASNAKDVLRDCLEEYDSQNRENKQLVIPSNEYWSAVWQSACLKLDQKLKEAHITEGGSTGVFALVTSQEIVVANIGDSRCILACKPDKTKIEPVKVISENTEGSATDPTAAADGESSDPPTLVEESSSLPSDVEGDCKEVELATNAEESPKTVVTALSEDHKPNLPDETARIRMAGFDVKSISVTEEDGTETIISKVVKNEKEQLAVSRAFGDFDYKANTTLGDLEQAVVPLADIKVHTRRPDTDLYMVLACDGIWDVMENHEVIDLVERQVKVKGEISSDSLLPDVADVLLNECLGRDSRDNMSGILVSFKPTKNDHPSHNDSIAPMPPKTLDFGSPK